MKRMLAALAALLASLVVVPGAVTPSYAAAPALSTTEATSFQQDAQHDGYQPAESLAMPLASAWTTADLGGEVSYPVVTGSRAFVISGVDDVVGSYLWCFDVVTGHVLWGPLDVSEYRPAAITADGGRLFAENYSGFVRAYDQSTGAELWGVQLHDADGGLTSGTSPNLVAANGTLYAQEGQYDGLLAIDEATGDLRWRGPGGGFYAGSPAVTADGVYIAGARRIDPATGSTLWSQQTVGLVGAAGPPAVSGQHVFSRTMNPPWDHGNDLDTTTGQSLGAFDSAVGPASDGSTVYRLDDSRFGADHAQQLVATDLTTRQTRWSFAGDGHLDSPPLLTPTALFVGSASGMLYAVSPTTGAVLWSASAGAPVAAPVGTPLDTSPLDMGCSCSSLAVAAGRLFVPAGNTLAVFAPAGAGGTGLTAPSPPTVTPPATGAGGTAIAFQQDPAHDGVAAGDDTTAPLHRQWSLDLGGLVSYPLIVNGTVYAVAEGADHVDVYAMEASTGTRKWGPRTIYGRGFGGQGSQLAYSAGTLFVTDSRNSVYAFNAVTGARLWDRLGAKVAYGNVAPVATGGRVFMGNMTQSGDVTVMDAVTGSTLWSAFTDWEGEQAGPAVAGTSVFVTSSDEQTDALDSTSGTRSWSSVPHIFGAGGATPASSGDLLVVRDSYGLMTAQGLSASTGSPSRDFETRTPLALSTTTAWVTQHRGLVAVDLTTRRQAWQYSDSTIVSAPVVANGVVYVGTSDGRVLGIDAAQGTPVWSAPLDGGMDPWLEGRVAQEGLAVAHGILAVPAGTFLDVFADARTAAPVLPPATPARPGAPTASTVTATPTGDIDVAWLPPTNPGTGVADYLVEADPPPYGTLPVVRTFAPAGSTSAHLTGLQPGTDYSVWVQTRDASNAQSARTTPVTVTTASIPTAPNLTTVTTGDRSVRLDWAASSAPDSSPVQGYDVYRSTTAGVQGTLVAAKVPDTTFTDTTVVNETSYYYTVAAVNGSGESAPSGQRRAVPHVPPTVTITGAPAHTTNATTAAFQFSWTSSPSSDSMGAKCAVDGATPVGCSSPWQVPGPLADGRHTMTVVVTDSWGETGSASYAWTVDGTAPSAAMTAPARMFQTGTSVRVAWRGGDAGSGVTSYDVRWRTAAWNGRFGSYHYPSGWQGTTATTATVTGQTGHEYCYSVRDRDAAGNVSGWSAERCSVVPLDDRGLRVTHTSWVRGGSSRDYLQTVTTTSSYGATLGVTGAVVRQVAVIVTTCSTCGRVRVIVGGATVGTLSLHSSSTRHRVLFRLPLVTLRTTGITLVAAGQGRVSIDGLAIRRR